MRKPLAIVFVVAANARARIADGAAEGFELQFESSTEQLLETAGQRDVGLAIVDAVDALGRSTAPTLTSLRAQCPDLPVLLYCAIGLGKSSSILDAVHSGVAGLIFGGVDDTRHALRAAISAAFRGSVAQRVFAEISSVTPASLHPLLRYAIAGFGEDVSVDDAAKSLNVDRKTLRNWLHARTALTPREFINWARLCVAIGLLANGRRSTEQIALDLGFPSATAFRNMIQRYVGEACSELRRPGGFERVLEEFKGRLGVDKRLRDVVTALPAIQRRA